MSSARRGEDQGTALRRLARDPLLPVYLLFGEEQYLVERALRTVLGRLQGSQRGLRVAAGEERLIARVTEALATQPLFGGRPFAVVTEVDALAEATQTELLALLPRDQSANLVLVGVAPDLRRRLYATCAREGWAFEFRRLSPGRLPAFLREEAARLGHALQPDAAEQLVDLVGPDLRVAVGEMEKLSLYVGTEQPIDAEAVAAVTGSSRARSVLELADLIQRRHLAPCLVLIRRLLEQGEQPIALIAFLAGQIRRMLIAKSLAPGRTAPAELAGRLGVSPWVAERISSGARRYDTGTLERALGRLASLDVAFKSSRPAAAVVLETCLLELRES